MKKRKGLSNLKPFKKGFDPRRNLRGQPRKLPELNAVLTECLHGKDGQELKRMITAIIARAKRGDVRAFAELMDRAYGKQVAFDAPIQSGGFDYTSLSNADLKQITLILSRYRQEPDK